jgi:hypothetical protein
MRHANRSDGSQKAEPSKMDKATLTATAVGDTEADCCTNLRGDGFRSDGTLARW